MTALENSLEVFKSLHYNRSAIIYFLLINTMNSKYWTIIVFRSTSILWSHKIYIRGLTYNYSTIIDIISMAISSATSLSTNTTSDDCWLARTLKCSKYFQPVIGQRAASVNATVNYAFCAFRIVVVALPLHLSTRTLGMCKIAVWHAALQRVSSTTQCPVAVECATNAQLTIIATFDEFMHRHW